MLKKICMMMITVLNLYSMEHRDAMRTTEFSFIIKPSASGDLSLFAAHDIAQGTELFHESFHIRVMKIKDVPDAFRYFVLPLNDEECACPERFDRLEAGWYMNISSTHANVAKKLDGVYETILDVLQVNSFYAIRDIKAGEEILIDVEQVKKHFPTK